MTPQNRPLDSLKTQKIQHPLISQVCRARFKEFVIATLLSKSKVRQGPAESLKQERPFDPNTKASVKPSMPP
jgi:hypothetical protein